MSAGCQDAAPRYWACFLTASGAGSVKAGARRELGEVERDAELNGRGFALGDTERGESRFDAVEIVGGPLVPQG